MEKEFEKLENTIQAKFDEVKNTSVNKSEFETKLKELQDLIPNTKELSDNVQKIKEFAENQAAEIAKLKEGTQKESKQENVTFMSELKKSYDSYRDKIKNSETKDYSFVLKALPIDTVNDFGASTNYPFKPSDDESGVTINPEQSLVFSNGVPTGSPIAANSDTWRWVEEGTVTDNTKMTAEGAIFGTVDANWAKQETKVKKISNYSKATREAFEDWNEFREVFNDVVIRKQNQKLNTQLFSGDGIGENLKGIQQYAVAFNNFGVTETNANRLDVLLTAIAQVYINGKDNWTPDRIYLHPSDVTAMRINKATDGTYVLPSFVLPNGQQVDGIQVVKTVNVTQGYFGVFTMAATRKRFKRELEVRIFEQNEDDAIHDLVTIATSQRVAFRIKAIEASAFVYDSFDAAIAIMKGATASLTLIQSMATDSDASKLTINLLTTAGVTGTDPTLLDGYKTAVAGEASIASLAALQTLIDAVV